MPEIMAFAEDRRIDPAVVAGAVEASMRLGRIPDLGLYGLAGDEALAVKDFVATAMLGLEHELRHGLPVITESHEKAAKHKGYSNHYRSLADHHAKEIEHLTQAAKKASQEGRPFSAAKFQGKIVMLKQLLQSHGALADYHSCEGDRCAKDAGRQAAVPTGAGPTNVDQPTGRPERPAHPAQGSTAAQRPQVPAVQRQEATTSGSLSPVMKLTQPEGSKGAFLRQDALLSRGKLNLTSGTQEDKKKKGNAVQFRHEQTVDGFFRTMPLMGSMLAEAEKAEKKEKKEKAEKKKAKKKGKAPSKKELGIKADPDKIDLTIANAKMAGLFQTLGHKMDHACAKTMGHKVNDKWAKLLNQKCLSKGGPEAYHEIVKSSLAEPWIRDQGFVEEAAQLNYLWQTNMSAASGSTVSKASPTTPEPLVFTINRMIDMAKGRGSVF
jgi:hypothetical protein